MTPAPETQVTLAALWSLRTAAAKCLAEIEVVLEAELGSASAEEIADLYAYLKSLTEPMKK